MCVRPLPCVAVNCTASSTASRPKSVVNLMTGLRATEDVSLNGSPTVSPMTVASWRGVPFCLSSTSTIFLALSQAPPALAMKMAWYRSEEHTSELQSQSNLVCRLLLEKKKKKQLYHINLHTV